MGKYARTEGMGSGILHQVCQVSKIHEVGLELLWRNLLSPYPEFRDRAYSRNTTMRFELFI